MEAAKIIAGYTLGGADMLRRAMGKKDAEAMAEERAKFVAGREEAPRDRREDVGRDLRHPEQVRRLRLQQVPLRRLRAPQLPDRLPQGELPGAVHGGDAQLRARQLGQGRALRRRVRGDGPRGPRARRQRVARDVHAASAAKIRFGLAGIKGVGELAAQRIIAEREANGPFADFDDFAARVDGRAVNKRVLEHLVKTGAFEFSGAAPQAALRRHRRRDRRRAPRSARDKAAGQHSFLGYASRRRRAERNGAAARQRRRGRRTSPRTSACPSRRSCSASTSRAIR